MARRVYYIILLCVCVLRSSTSRRTRFVGYPHGKGTYYYIMLYIYMQYIGGGVDENQSFRWRHVLHTEEWYTTNYWNTDTSRVRFNIYINIHMRIYAYTYVTCVYIKAERSYMYILCYWQRVEQYYRILYISVLYRIPCTN